MSTLVQPGQGGPRDGLRGMNLLNHPALNKGTAFTEEERRELGLVGLLPPHVETLDEQVVRAYEAYKRKDDDLERHIYLLRSRIRTRFFFTGFFTTISKR